MRRAFLPRPALPRSTLPRLALALAVAAAVLAAAAALLPASLLSRIAAQRIAHVALRDAEGTVWSGAAALFAGDWDLGVLDWSLHPALLLGGELGGDWRLRHAQHDVAGFAACGMNACRATLAGTVDAAALEALLAGYPVAVSGPPLEIDTLAVRTHRDGCGADGRMRWSGGSVRYSSGAFGTDRALPALVAELRSADSGVAATVSSQSRHLIEARLGCNGILDAGLTVGFARLFQTFPSSMRDDAIALRVSAPLWTRRKLADTPQ